MQLNKIYTGDCLEWLRQMPDNFIDCCVTSPPYFGLRDYQTAVWSGGDEGCDHIAKNGRNDKGRLSTDERKGINQTPVDTPIQFSTDCLKCGATRIDSQIGLEESPEAYVSKLVEVFTEVRRVLKKEGSLWLNIGDSYNGNNINRSGQNGYNDGRENRNKRFSVGGLNNCKPKDLIGIPWMVAFALRSSGWYLRQDIIWHKPNPMPESVTDRCTKAHEYIFLMSKSGKYYYDAQAIKGDCKDTTDNRAAREKEYHLIKNGISRVNPATAKCYEVANKRSVWTVTTKPYSEAHFATFPEDLISDCIKAGCPENGLILDPFMGAGTTAIVAKKLNRNYIGIELNESYVSMANKRLYNEIGLFL